MAPLEAVIKYTLWRNSEENKNCLPLQKVMIKTEVVICKFHAKSNSTLPEVFSKDSNAAAALSLWLFHFLGFLVIAFFLCIILIDLSCPFS